MTADSIFDDDNRTSRQLSSTLEADLNLTSSNTIYTPWQIHIYTPLQTGHSILYPIPTISMPVYVQVHSGVDKLIHIPQAIFNKLYQVFYKKTYIAMSLIECQSLVITADLSLYFTNKWLQTL